MKTWYQTVVLPKLLSDGMNSAELKEVRQEVLKDATGVVLEIGVGPGYNIPLYKNISRLFALEPSPELMKIAEERSKVQPLSFSVNFLNIPAEKISLPDASIDTVVSTWTLCSVKNPQKVLQEIKRVLRPGGKFIFADHGAAPTFVVRIAQTLFTSVSKYFTGNCHCDRDIEKLIKRAGFTLQKIEYPSEDTFRPMIYNYQGVAVKK